MYITYFFERCFRLNGSRILHIPALLADEAEYNRTIMKNIHEQDHITQELERTRVEKEEMERVLKTELLKAVETSAEEADADKHMASYGRKHILRIDITYLV